MMQLFGRQLHATGRGRATTAEQGKATSRTTGESIQLTYARIAGLALLLIIGSSMLSTDFVVPGDAAATAHNIMAHERRFRIGLAGELFMVNNDVWLAAALYAVLRPVDATLALLGSFWRVANAIVQGFGIVAALVALDVLRDVHYVASFKTEQMQAIARQLLDVHGTAMLVGLVFFSLGAATHSYLLWQSRYIPRILSASYLGVALIILLSSSAIIISPGLDAIIDPWFVLPDFVVELLVGLWLLAKGVDTRQLK